jgi:CubicO group peptidase (beta-lactamase class C family)
MIASASKWLEAATVMALVDESKLDLDKPIATYLPELAGAAGTNTLRQIFSHTSTLNSIELPRDKSLADTDHFPALLAGGSTRVQPGAVFSYGGTALAVAARAIEVVTGKPWLTVFAEKIAKPCRMKATVTGHNLWTFSGIVGGDNFPCSNAADYMNFLQMLLNDGVFEGKRVLSAAAVREMQADQIGKAEVKRPEYIERALNQTHHGVYGLGEWRMLVDEAGEAVVLSSPSFAGFFPWIDKKRGIAGVFVGRASGGIDAFHASAALVPLVGRAVDERDAAQK